MSKISSSVAAAALLLVGGFGTPIHARASAELKFRSQPASTHLIRTVEAAPFRLLNRIGGGGLHNPWAGKKRLSWLSSSKPVFFSYYADWCPHCSVVQWSLINTLGRFGAFKIGSIWTMLSSAIDMNPNTRSFTFLHTRYKSKYIRFEPLDAEGREHQTLQRPTNVQKKALKRFNQTGGFPFIDLGNRLIGSEPANYDESAFFSKSARPRSWSAIARDLSNPRRRISRDVLGLADWFTAGICVTTHNKPSTACGTAPVKRLEARVSCPAAPARSWAT